MVYMVCLYISVLFLSEYMSCKIRKFTFGHVHLAKIQGPVVQLLANVTLNNYLEIWQIH